MSSPLFDGTTSAAVGRQDPLSDTLFRPTILSPVVASAAPVRERGTRSRAGNAMSRTRTALLEGAARAVAESGVRITMSQVAAAAGVAKATLYNHLRTREAVLAALIEHQVELVVIAQEGKDLATSLADAAVAISESPLRAGLAQVDPAVLAEIGRIDPTAAGWVAARAAVEQALAAANLSGTGAVDTVLRWLSSFLLTPAPRSVVDADVATLIAGLSRTSRSGGETVTGGTMGDAATGGTIGGEHARRLADG